ncbi:hypothetical protein COBT_003992, partial [Conglomerata obtusa]
LELLNYGCIKNGFTIDVILGNKCVKALIDTGADVSVLPIKMLHGISYAQNMDNIKIKSASGNDIKVCFKTSIKLEYENKNYMIEPYITTHNINKIILGQDFILKNSDILINLLKQKKESKDLNVINLDCTKNDPNNQ